MNDSDKKEFLEWFVTMKERVNEILNNNEIKNEQKQIFIERSVEPYGTWKLDRRRNGTQNNTVPNKIQDKEKYGQSDNGSLSKVIEKYNLIKDDQGIRIGSFIKDWKECSRELEREGYRWNTDLKHFIKSGQ